MVCRCLRDSCCPPTPATIQRIDDHEHIATAKKMKAAGHTGKDIAKYLGVRRATLYRYLTEDDAA
jgi:DNA invertase Pin-like site-specific DNA recombinase